MKFQSLKYCSALFVLAFSLGLGQKNQAFGQCPASIAGLSGSLLNSSIQAFPGYPSSPAHFLLLVTDNNEPLPIGQYLTWCVDEHGDIQADYGYPPITSYSGLLYPTCDPNLNSELPPGHTSTSYVTPAVWQQVNYILNHKNGAGYWEIQVAIFDLVGGPAGPSPPDPPYDPSVVQSLTNAAVANAGSWTPQCGDVLGVIYVITNQTAGSAIQTAPFQFLMIEVPNVCLTCPVSCGNVGTPYSSALIANAKTLPYTYSIVSGSLPPGLTLNATTGVITGTPNKAGTFPFTAKVVDSTTPAPQSTTVSCSITIYAMTLACPTGTGQVGVPYSSGFTASGGSGSYKYTISVGALPGGLTLNSTTGVITGTPTNAGTFNYTAYVQDNTGCGSAIQPCSITVNPPPTGLVGGDAATIGFWHNKNGQALILSFNGGGSSTKLGNWMASNYPCMFGNLAGKTNGFIAAQFLTYFNVTGQKTYAQVMAGALACYATSSTLAGGSMAGAYGFNVSASGTGAKTYNTGSNGTAIGLSNNTSYTVFQLLTAANAKCPWNATVFNALNTIFNGINTTGDIQ